MTTTVHGYAVHKAGGELTPYEYELGELHPDEVDVAVRTCGICYSDISMIDNAWGFSTYPMVPGHEIIGEVRAVGKQVTHLRVGDNVGVGWHSGYCMTCSDCMRGEHHMCVNAVITFVGRPGGYADIVRAQAPAVFKMPKGIDLSAAGPLMCGGITVFTLFSQFNIPPTASVGVIGIGGLGHLAIKFARAWGCNVTAFTSTKEKQQQALELGAHDVLDSRDTGAIAGASNRFDLLISTVNVPLDWNAYLGTLRKRGRLHFLGAVKGPLGIVVPQMMMGHRSVSSSAAGSPSDIEKMLKFVASHGISPTIERFSFSQVNEAIEHVRSGKARYRVVLEN